MKRVLFVCVHNSGRSQIVEAFARRFAEGVVEVESAGTMPSDGVNPLVVDVMKEKGIEVSDRKPKLLTAEMLEAADRVITMGCKIDTVPGAGPLSVEDWGIDDPSGKPRDEVRRIRDDVESKVNGLLRGPDSGRRSGGAA